jgi:hypothetical protein
MAYMRDDAEADAMRIGAIPGLKEIRMTLVYDPNFSRFSLKGIGHRSPPSQKREITDTWSVSIST